MDHDTSAPQKMFQMITGYWVSQTVGTIAELGLVDRLTEEADTPEGLASRIGVDPRALARLLRTAGAVGLVARGPDGRWAPTPLGATLHSAAPGSMRDMAIAQTAPGHWLPWGRLTDAVKTGARQTPAALGAEIFEHYGKNPREAAAFSGAMRGLSTMVAREVARVLDTRTSSVVVDVGGATGTLLAAVVGANERLHGLLLDLPHVAEAARAALVEAGVGTRCEVLAGDFFQRVPEADLYLLKQVLHDWNDEQARTLLRNIASSMRPGGRVVIVEMVIPDDGRPTAAQLMDLNMLVMLPGRERTQAEYTALLADAGLRLERLVETHSPFQILEAVPA